MHSDSYISSCRFIRKKEVIRLTGLSASSIYARAAEGAFPPPIKIGGRASAWLEGEVREWMADRIATSREGV